MVAVKLFHIQKAATKYNPDVELFHIRNFVDDRPVIVVNEMSLVENLAGRQGNL